MLFLFQQQVQVLSERLFNYARDICHYRRGSLNIATIQDIMMFRCISSLEIETRSFMIQPSHRKRARRQMSAERLSFLIIPLIQSVIVKRMIHALFRRRSPLFRHVHSHQASVHQARDHLVGLLGKVMRMLMKQNLTMLRDLCLAAGLRYVHLVDKSVQNVGMIYLLIIKYKP